MNKLSLFVLQFLSVFCFLIKSNYFIDVVIPCHAKDAGTLELCIAGVKNNVKDLRRVIIISSTKLSDNAEWFPESKYPFSFEDIRKQLHHASSSKKYRVGWYLQQLLKLYAPFVVPDISDDILVVDADTVFLKPVSFIDDEGYALYNVGTEYHKPYFNHAKKLLPCLIRVFPKYSGICHHMLIQRHVLIDLFNKVQTIHNKPFWKVFCKSVYHKDVIGAGAAEYEIYFNYIFSHNYKVKIRKLNWDNFINFNNNEKITKGNYDYVSCHRTVESYFGI